MKMLNTNFNEKKLNFSHWSDFVSGGREGRVTSRSKGGDPSR